MGDRGSSDGFLKKIYPDQGLGYYVVVFTLQEVKAHVQADGLRAVGVTDVKLFIFQPQTQWPKRV